jgi:hypothetical protein
MVPQRMLSQAPFLAPRCLWLCGEIVTSSNRESSKSSSFQGVPIFLFFLFGLKSTCGERLKNRWPLFYFMHARQKLAGRPLAFLDINNCFFF